MNTEMKQLVKEFKQKFVEISDENVVHAQININCDGFTVGFKFKTAEQLRKRGISMRNIKGEFIK